MENTERILTIKLDGEAVRSGRVSFAALASKLSAAQSALYNLALSRSESGVASRGTWPGHIRASCELFLSKTETGSLTLTSELGNNPVLSGMPDLGVEAIRDLPGVVSAVNSKNVKELYRLMPDSVGRGRTLKSLQLLCPRNDENLFVYIGNGTGAFKAELTPETRQHISDIFETSASSSESDSIKIIGDLVEIRVKAGTRHIVVRHASREILCLYPSDMEEQISQLIAGSIVEVFGSAQRNYDGSVKQIDDVYDVSTVDLSPFYIGSFVSEKRRFRLTFPVSCFPAYRNDLWIYECPRYGMVAFSADRQQAVLHLHEEFAFLYDGLVDESDEDLTEDAIDLRNLIENDVAEVEEVA